MKNLSLWIANLELEAEIYLRELSEKMQPSMMQSPMMGMQSPMTMMESQNAPNEPLPSDGNGQGSVEDSGATGIQLSGVEETQSQHYLD
jgi:hypothetical protein